MDKTTEQLAQELKEFKQRLQLLETSTDWIWSIDLAGNIIYSNPAIVGLLGYEVEEVVGGSSFPFMHPDDQSLILEMYQKAVSRKEGWSNWEIRWLHKNGSVRFFESTAQPVFDEDGNLTGYNGIDRDITQRKQAEKELLQYKALITQLNDLVYICDTQGNILLVNDVFEEFTGRAPKEFYGKSFVPLFDEENLQKAMDLYNRTLHGESLRFELAFKDTGILCEYKSIPFRDNKGNIIGVIGIARDIMRHKKNEEELDNYKHLEDLVSQRTEELQKWKNVFDHAEWGIAISTGSPAFFGKVNPQMTKMYGYSQEEMMGMAVSNIFLPEDQKKVAEYAQKSIKEGNCTFETRQQRKNGSVFPVLINLTAVKDNRGNLLYHVASIQDITELKEAENRIKESDFRYQRLVESMSEGLCVINQHSEITYVNPRLCEMFDRSENEIVGYPVTDFMNDASRDRFLEEMKKRRVGKATTYELTYVQQGGNEVFTLTSGTPIMGDNNQHQGSFAVITDVTKLKKTEYELAIAKEQAESASLAKTKFLTNMSHEIRTPLGAIIGFNQILLNKSKELSLPEEYKKYQKNIHNSANLLNELINNILDLSKIESGKLEAIEEDFYLDNLIKGLFETYDYQARQKGVHFSYHIDPNILSPIRADKNKISEILINLIGNAIKFTPAGKEVKLKVVRDNSILAFMVIDHGIGIPKDRQSIIFDAFEQVDRSIAYRYGGTGLGLAISQKLATIMGGKINVVSEEGRGSNFCVLLPYQEAAESIPRDTAYTTFPPLSFIDSDASPSSFLTGTTILVVEDNLMNQELIAALFVNLGVQLHFANNGKEGIEKALALQEEGTLPDLILMDIQMPIMDGIEATQHIRSDPELKNIPVVALSADAFAEQQAQALSIGMNDYLTKPIEMDNLLLVLQKYLQKES